MKIKSLINYAALVFFFVTGITYIVYNVYQITCKLSMTFHEYMNQGLAELATCAVVGLWAALVFVICKTLLFYDDVMNPID